MLRSVAYAWSCLLVLSLVGCSGQSSPPANIEGEPGTTTGSEALSPEPAETFRYVISEEVEYYTTGPQQGRPPDGTLPQGTKVDVRRRTGGYSLIKSADGVEGYVLSEAIQDPGSKGTLP